jgi:hypothetical protein
LTGTINVYIDSVHNSPREPSLKMDLTKPQGILALLYSPYYEPSDPIHVNPSFFRLRADVQAEDMAHELGRYFGGITAEGDYGDDMSNFDLALDKLEAEYNRTHPQR